MSLLEPQKIKRLFKWILVSLTAGEIVWLYSILIFILLHIISFQLKRYFTNQDELMQMIWWCAHLVTIIILRVATAYHAYFKDHTPSFFLIWSFDAVVIILTVILLPATSVNTGVIIITRFVLEILLSVFLFFLNVSDPLIVQDEQIMSPGYVVRRIYVHNI